MYPIRRVPSGGNRVMWFTFRRDAAFSSSAYRIFGSSLCTISIAPKHGGDCMLPSQSCLSRAVGPRLESEVVKRRHPPTMLSLIDLVSLSLASIPTPPARVAQHTPGKSPLSGAGRKGRALSASRAGRSTSSLQTRRGCSVPCSTPPTSTSSSQGLVTT